jgi:putative Holliday junction resolvase
MPGFLALDYGLRRIGIAASDPDCRLAFALGTHVEGRDGSILARLKELIREREATAVVLGLPLTASGSEGEMAAKVRNFAERLEQECGVEVILWDERYSSAEADRWLGPGRRSDKEDRDAVAAQIILQSYLDSLTAEGGPDPERP